MKFEEKFKTFLNIVRSRYPYISYQLVKPEIRQEDCLSRCRNISTMSYWVWKLITDTRIAIIMPTQQILKGLEKVAMSTNEGVQICLLIIWFRNQNFFLWSRNAPLPQHPPPPNPPSNTIFLILVLLTFIYSLIIPIFCWVIIQHNENWRCPIIFFFPKSLHDCK